MTPPNLSPDELLQWTQWKTATDTVWAHVVTEISRATGLSAADFSVLTRVIEGGRGTMRQQPLADELGWQRARLSRQVTRMVERGLVERTTDGAVVTVTATTDGRRVTKKARRAHARAVRSALLDLAPPDSSATFWATVARLGTTSPT